MKTDAKQATEMGMTAIFPFLSLNRHWSLIINHYVSLLLYATSYRGVSNMIVEAVHVKDEVLMRQQELMLRGDGKKRVSFLFHLPSFLQANLCEITKLTRST